MYEINSHSRYWFDFIEVPIELTVFLTFVPISKIPFFYSVFSVLSLLLKPEVNVRTTEWKIRAMLITVWKCLETMKIHWICNEIPKISRFIICILSEKQSRGKWRERERERDKRKRPETAFHTNDVLVAFKRDTPYTKMCMWISMTKGRLVNTGRPVCPHSWNVSVYSSHVYLSML